MRIVFSSSVQKIFALASQYLFHKIPHLLRRTLLHLTGGVRVSAQGEARIIVTQHVGHCFHVHAVLQSNGRECVTKIVETDVRQSCVLQNLLVEVHYGIRVVHSAGLGGWEQVWVVWMLAVFFKQEIDGRLVGWRFHG